ncbi:MAG: insulinase family protein [Clostridia bacterium]|nr:insulinase family protein [Clostridia bacterium]
MSRLSTDAAGRGAWAHARTLPNGLTLLAEPVPGAASVSLGLWIGAGSRDDPDGRSGLAHALEHLVFKGSARRDGAAIAREIDDLGGHVDAFTTKELTCYWARVLPEHLERALDLLYELAVEPALSAGDFERERRVLLEELGGYEDSPEDFAADLFDATLWPGEPVGRPIIGLREQVAALSIDDIRAFHQRWYRPCNAVLAAAGAIEPEAWFEAAGRRFAEAWRDAGSGDAVLPPHRRAPRPARTGQGDVIRPRRDLEQVYVLMGGPAPDARDRAGRAAVEVASTVLGGGTSSRLFHEIRERRGLAYNVYTFDFAYLGAGAFGVGLSAHPPHAAEAVAAANAQIEALAKDGPTAEELRRARDQLRIATTIGLESASARVQRLAQETLLFGQAEPIETAIARYERVTAEDVARVCRDALLQAPVRVAYGPAKRALFPEASAARRGGRSRPVRGA